MEISLVELEVLMTSRRQDVAPDKVAPPAEEVEKRYVIVRGDHSGVFCGFIVSEEGPTVELTECRHIWYWAGAANTAEMALTGVARPAECKFIAPVGRLRVLDAIEVIDCTAEAETSLRAVPVWTQK